MKKALIIISFFIFIVNAVVGQKIYDRDYWVETMIKIVDPIYKNLSENQLRIKMPVETNDGLNTGKRKEVSHLEALGRSFCGIAPWLNLGCDETKEGKLRKEYITLCIRSIVNAVNPESPDYMRFDGPGGQPLVDAAFFAHGLLRSKEQIWSKLDSITKQRIVKELKASRKIKPGQSNWLLFSAMIEAALLEFTGECDMEPVNYAIKKHKEWYKGDGWYGDGSDFHLDYYNSYVIQPMLLDIVRLLKEKGKENGDFYDVEWKRFKRYAAQQEKLISPEGTYPVLGRSMAYRFGCFQVLSQAVLQNILPEDVQPAQVRCALTKVIKRQINAKNTFDSEGWLRLGFYGHQPNVAENYVSTGSLYLCTFVFLPLGLDSTAPFWVDEPADWSSVKIWKGQDFKADHAL
ncbi:hypothetical protein EZS27_001103 [termite gut metagenome]|uniref:DUF2264 domain-containing protein n=1 Tax=termite gut metagenome TaxID=433724 RepID=A0A5J4T2A2_9ZZZZ